MTRQIHLNGFEMNTVSHINHGLWRHPSNRRHEYTDLEYWTETAQLLERGLFDAIFLADVVGTYDTYGGSRDPAVERGLQVPNNDPFLLVPAMAAVTKNLGFAVTFSTTYEPPFGNARRLSTLDHLTKGRVAWNVVTGYLPDAARNFGLPDTIRHDDRYDIAEEYLDVSYKLWEGSWDSGAVVRDAERGVYTEASGVHEIGHRGRFFQVDGPHLSEPSLQRTPVIYQAGSSGRGKDFAAHHAEAVFVHSQTIGQVANDVADLRARAEAAGRGRHDVKILAGLNLVLGKTEAEVARKVEEVVRLRDVEGHLVHFGGSSGIDLKSADTENYLDYVGRDHSESMEAEFTRGPNRKKAHEIIDTFSDPRRSDFFLAGTPENVADRIEEIMDATDLDGFNLIQFLSPGTFADVVELLVPELQKRGRYRTSYDEATLRERLFPGAGPLLPASHPGAAYRGAFSREHVGGTTRPTIPVPEGLLT